MARRMSGTIHTVTVEPLGHGMDVLVYSTGLKCYRIDGEPVAQLGPHIDGVEMLFREMEGTLAPRVAAVLLMACESVVMRAAEADRAGWNEARENNQLLTKAENRSISEPLLKGLDNVSADATTG